ncbi:uncharacterized protein LDX57_001856 [Aspergillus melleus]|uniref:uncharacterized protein n=1 Tax=Aspergillus melleus TaxID=138277 RepID=UPI001E8DC61A|nr:uncharacterized protein LDX57_001856 [Aspergillus melleus]KAH8424099.1 hypothetical protein LDX57_001856 [Aspergillus melleus]
MTMDIAAISKAAGEAATTAATVALSAGAGVAAAAAAGAAASGAVMAASTSALATRALYFSDRRSAPSPSGAPSKRHKGAVFNSYAVQRRIADREKNKKNNEEGKDEKKGEFPVKEESFYE